MDPRSVPVRFSHLKRMALSAMHYRSSLEEEGEDSVSLRIGRLGHAIALRGVEAFAVYDGERRGNAWKEFKAANEGADIVTMKEFDRGRRIAEAVWSNPDAAALLDGRHEVKVPWKFCDRACHSTIDVLSTGFVTELKTCRLAAPGWFRVEAMKRSYHAQLAWYQDAASYADHYAHEAYIVAVESSPPHAVTCFQLTPRALEEGRKLCRLWFEQLRICEAGNEWPAYAQSVLELDVPDEVELEFAPEEAAADAVGF